MVKCPSSEEMAALYDGALSKKMADPVRSHLAHCSRCAQEFRVLHNSLTQLDLAPRPPARLINLLKDSSLTTRPTLKRTLKSKRLTTGKQTRNAHK